MCMNGFDVEIAIDYDVKMTMILVDFHWLYFLSVYCHGKMNSALQQLYEDREDRVVFLLLMQKDVVLLM